MLSLLKIKSNCFIDTLSEEERKKDLKASAARIILQIYDSRIQSANADLAVSAFFEKMLEASVDLFQTVRVRLYHDKLASDSQDYSLHRLLILIAGDSGNVKLLHRLFQVLPEETVSVLDALFTSVKDNFFFCIIEALYKFYDSDFATFERFAAKGDKKITRTLFYRVFAVKDRQGDALMAFLEARNEWEKIDMLNFMLDIGCLELSEDEKEQAFQRNLSLYRVFGSRHYCSFAFNTLNKWIAYQTPSVHEDLEMITSERYLGHLCPIMRATLAKFALKRGTYFDCVFSKPEALEDRVDFHLKKLKKRQKEFGAMLDDQFPEFEIQRLLAEHPSKSIKSILGLPEVSVLYRARIAFLYAEPSREVFELVLHDEVLERSLVLDFFELLLRIRSGKEDLVTWMTALIDFAVERGFVLRGNSTSAFFDLSVLSVPQVYQFLAHPRLSQFLGSNPAKQAILYTNYDSIFDYCIRTPQFFKQIMADPLGVLILNSLKPFLFPLLMRCDSVASVERLLELSARLLILVDFHQVVNNAFFVLFENGIERIGSLKPVLLYWRKKNPEHFTNNCPQDWQQALNALVESENL